MYAHAKMDMLCLHALKKNAVNGLSAGANYKNDDDAYWHDGLAPQHTIILVLHYIIIIIR